MEFLKTLGVNEFNPGACFGLDEWSETTDQGVIESHNPATGELIGSIYGASEADYERLMETAQSVFEEWRKVPAPQRGEAVRLCTEALRRNKDALGSLVAMEMGKIKPEGDGEVQEMIDIGDFAVGQSRMLYGLTMHSERPQHRMYEQWHPLGVVGVISAFNFPVAVWAWNAFISAICGNVTVWKPSSKVPLCMTAVQNICNEALKDGGFPPIFMSFAACGHDNDALSTNTVVDFLFQKGIVGAGQAQVDDIGLLERYRPGIVFETRRVAHRLHDVVIGAAAALAQGPDRHDARVPTGPGNPNAVVRLRGDGADHMAAVEYTGSGVLSSGVTGVGVDAVAVQRVGGVADEVIARCGQLAAQIGMIEQDTRVDNGNDHVGIAGGRVPGLWQIDQGIMPLLKV